MTTLLQQLAHELEAAHAAAPESRKVASIHLFGISNRSRLQGVNKHDLAEAAGLSRSYGAELAKGAVLGEYVDVVRPLA